MKKVFLVAAGKDQAGIVAALTGGLYELSCNLEDTSMILLEDHFSVMMMFVPPPGSTVEILESALQSHIAPFNLSLTLFTVDVLQERQPRTGTPWMIGVTSPDQTGIIYHVSQALAASGINIYQLASRRLPSPTGDSDKPLYLVSLEVDVPEPMPEEAVEILLSSLGGAHGFDIQAHPLETFRL
jgi:predicted amino acid-binding ACT domain protein